MPLGLQMADCNANGIPDANDIDEGASLDCNHNFIPDECDIDTNDPDGNEAVSADVNANSMPDECEADCNVNSAPDAWDITQSTSVDVNVNGIPDECEKDCNENGRPDDLDVACGGGNTCNSLAGSYDCNSNGTPDECEVDCNENGVPDECDIDPLDPDGNEEVSDDCNADGMPDECNMVLPPPFGSFDCNENGTLDECDIKSGYSQDTNSNKIPDECESGQLMAGGGHGGTPHSVNDPQDTAVSESDTAGETRANKLTHATPGGETGPANDAGDDNAQQGMASMMQSPNQEAAWEAFYEWSFSQCWGLDCESTTSEQFTAYVNKLAELGLAMP